MPTKPASIMRLIPLAVQQTARGFAQAIGIPRFTLLSFQTGHRQPPDWLWERIALAFGVGKSSSEVRDIHGRRFQAGLGEWWQEKALPYLSGVMSRPHPGPRSDGYNQGKDIPSWPNNEAELLRALLRAAERGNRLPVAANVIRRALMEAARTLHLEQEWEQEAQASGVKDIRYCLSPVDLDKAALPGVSVSARQWSLSASLVPVTATADNGEDDAPTPSPRNQIPYQEKENQAMNTPAECPPVNLP